MSKASALDHQSRDRKGATVRCENNASRSLAVAALIVKCNDRGVIGWMVVVLVMLLAMRGYAASPTVVVLNPQQGPPTQKDFQEQRLQQLMGYLGMPARTMNPTETGGGEVETGQPDAIALPDISRTIPTTTEPKRLSSSLQILLLLSVLTLAPSILLMMTCFTRIVIVMSLLRQALGANQLPPNQILVGLSLFMTFLVMAPTWSRINTEAIQPYNENRISQFEAFGIAKGHLRAFMIKQIEAANNEEDVYLFHGYAHPGATLPRTWEEVETTSLVPAFVLSELKVAFLMGFRIYLPFLIIDMVISSVLISIGMQLLPPVMVSLPFKLLLFVLVDGWRLVCSTLLASFG
ncbi:MAG: flagellar type III secretion system pore protein FliP [Phycisphaerales bacterium]|nr:flagellar type III secretion system pore protein FliP [Phycisphaerales bacterium]